MRNWQACVSVVLVISLYHVSVIQSLEAASTDAASISGQVAEYGVGAKLNLKLADGKSWAVPSSPSTSWDFASQSRTGQQRICVMTKWPR